jgi:hypothetical protein
MGVGVAVDMAVLVGAMVVVGKDVAMGTGVDVGADAGAQADNIMLISKNTSNVRFIVRILLSVVSAAQQHPFQPLLRSSSRLEAGVRRSPFLLLLVARAGPMPAPTLPGYRLRRTRGR